MHEFAETILRIYWIGKVYSPEDAYYAAKNAREEIYKRYPIEELTKMENKIWNELTS